MMEKPNNKKWIIVSNRLPVHYDKKTDKFMQSSGGLVSALGNVKLEGERKWVGYADYPEKVHTIEELFPVAIEKDIYEKYYNDMSNNVLWPLFHYESSINFNWDAWEAYKKVNKIFAEKILSIASADDVVWIHDYHLFLLPRYLRKKNPNLKIGFFLHIPFPSSEVFRTLSVRTEILEGVLHSNLIGFQDFDSLRHFSSSTAHILGIDSDLMNISTPKYQTQLGVFPVSIDVKKFLKKKKSPMVANWVKTYERKDKQIILGVDRLDYIKGIDLKFKAFRELLIRYPEWRGKLCLYQVAVPSRIHVEDYIQTRNEVERLVGQINGEFGTPGYSPIHYIFASVSFDQLLALYSISDILYVSSKRDGMNLVSMEYIVSQLENPGVVVLSEFTGAASILSHSLRVNPWNLTETADVLNRALLMDRTEKKSRLKYMESYLKSYDASSWAESFIKKLTSASLKVERKKSEKIPVTSKGKVKFPKELEKAIKKNKVVLFIDYDGTLTPIVKNPSEAILSDKIKNILKSLSKKKYLYGFVLVSGRDSRFISTQVEGIEVSIASEHGARFFDRTQKKWISLVHNKKIPWYSDIKKIMNDYTKRVPDSFMEKKEFSLSWHYRNSPPVFGEYQARKLYEELESLLANQQASILWGKKVIEARVLEANKGHFAGWFMSSAKRSGSNDDFFIIAIGDDQTDEDMFRALAGYGASIRVGTPDTLAGYYLDKQEDVIPLLEFIDKLIQ